MSIFLILVTIISSPPFVIFHYCYLPFPYFHCFLPCLFVTLLRLMILYILVHKGWLCHSIHSSLGIDSEILALELLYGRGFRHLFMIEESLLILYVSR